MWIALDAATCRSIEEHVPGVTRAPGLPSKFRVSPEAGAGRSAHERSHNHVLCRNTQNIAVRAAFLARFVRFSIEYIANLTPANRFAPAMESAQRHFEAFQGDIERHVTCFVDRPAAANLCASLTFPFVPLIIAELEDANCEKLNGVPMSREHNAEWLKYFGSLQKLAHGSSRRLNRKFPCDPVR